MKKILYILTPIILLSSFLVKENSTAEIIKRIKQHFQQRPMERIFLHLDKPYYASGDDLWYSGYVLNYNSNTASELSEILHVELFNNEGTSIIQQKNRVTDGLAQGVLKLPDSLRSDYYLIKGYTNWSRNFEDGLLFSHYVKIVSPNFDPTKTESSFNQVNFYPEGGEILARKVNHVVFKSEQETTDNAYLITSKNDTIDKIEYNGGGFGMLKLIPPSADEEFFLTFENSKTRFALPKAKESGSVLRLVERTADFNLFLENSLDIEGKKFTFLILKNGNPVSAQEGKFSKQGTLLRLPKQQLPKGLLHILVIDENMIVRNQRMFYNEPSRQDETSIKIETNEKYEIGDVVKVKLTPTEEIVANLSVSVTPVHYFGETPKPMISTGRLMPHSGPDGLSKNDLLITEEIDTYEIEEILEGESPTFDYLIEKNDLFQISVQLEQEDSAYYSISLKSNDSIDFYFNAVAESKTVSFTFPAFNGRKSVIIKRHAGSESINNIPYTLNNAYPARPFKRKFNQSASETAYARYAKENQLIRRLYEVTDKKRVKSQAEPLSFSVLSAPDVSYVLKDYISLPDMLTISKEILSGVRFSKKDESYKIQMRTIDEETGYYQALLKDEPLRFIDGLPIYDSKYIAELNPLDVKKINMYYGKGVLNGVPFDGIFSIETEEGNFGRVNDLGQIAFDFSGYAEEYTYVNARSESNTPDFRSTYYWNPSVQLEDKPVTLSFPTSDEPGTYAVDIQGINAKGELITEKISFEVVKPTLQD